MAWLFCPWGARQRIQNLQEDMERVLKEWAVYKQDKRNEANALDERCKELKRQALVDYHEGRTTDAHVATREYLSNQRLRDKALKEIERYTAREEQIRSLWQDNQAAEINKATAKMLKRIAKHQDPEAAALDIDETEDIYDHFDEVAEELEQEVSRIRTAPRNEADSPDEIEDILRGWSVPGAHAMSASAAAAAVTRPQRPPPIPMEHAQPPIIPYPVEPAAVIVEPQLVAEPQLVDDGTAEGHADHYADEQQQQQQLPQEQQEQLYDQELHDQFQYDLQEMESPSRHEQHLQREQQLQEHLEGDHDQIQQEEHPQHGEQEGQHAVVATETTPLIQGADDDTSYHGDSYHGDSDDSRQMWEQRIPQENKDKLSTTVLEDLQVPTHELPSGNDTDPEDQGEQLLASVPV